jgi:hypothetical protein
MTLSRVSQRPRDLVSLATFLFECLKMTSYFANFCLFFDHHPSAFSVACPHKASRP